VDFLFLAAVICCSHFWRGARVLSTQPNGLYVALEGLILASQALWKDKPPGLSEMLWLVLAVVMCLQVYAAYRERREHQIENERSRRELRELKGAVLPKATQDRSITGVTRVENPTAERAMNEAAELSDYIGTLPPDKAVELFQEYGIPRLARLVEDIKIIGLRDKEIEGATVWNGTQLGILRAALANLAIRIHTKFFT
jgi:hypothetical protein